MIKVKSMKLICKFSSTLLGSLMLALGLLPQAFAQSDFVESGFLEDYSILTPDPDRPSVRIYMAPGSNFADFDKVLFADFVFYLHPQSEYQGISARKINEVTSEFEKYVRENIETRRELVTEVVPGDKVLVFRIAISNVYAKRN